MCLQLRWKGFPEAGPAIYCAGESVLRMKLDFFTLYLVILLNSIMLCVVWAGFVCVHRAIPGARFWLAACLVTTAGGLLLAFEESEYAHALTVSGNACVVLGFCLMWSGIRSFYGMRPLWRINAIIVVWSVCAMMLAGESRASQNVIYAGAQIIPLGLAIFALMNHGRFSLGAIVATCAISIALLGQGAEATLNIMRLTGNLETAEYYGVAAYLLVAVIFGGSLWNLGFLLMAIDRLRSELAQLALFDDLTRLPNRRNFIDAAERRMAQTRRTNKGFAIFFIDVDRFKQINDMHGHAAGDACLKYFAELASRCVGDSGILARLGGDEFGVIIRDTERTSTRALADDLVRLAAAGDFCWRQRSIPLSISIGVAEWCEGGISTVAELMESADAALYETKRHGRNGYALAREAQSTTVYSSPFAVAAE